MTTIEEEHQQPAKRQRLDYDPVQTAFTEGTGEAKRDKTGPESAATVPDTTNGDALQTNKLTQIHIFQNLRLRRIVRENHLSDINEIALFFYRPSEQRDVSGTSVPNKDSFNCSGQNTVDPDQITHGMGGLSAYERTFDKRGGVKRESDDKSNLLATVGQFQANIYDNEHCGDHLDIMSHYSCPSESYRMLSCCWIPAKQDALLSIAGEEGVIRILSLAWSREIRVLRGHKGKVTDLQRHPNNPQFILSVSSDKTMRVWDSLTGECVCIYKAVANVARFHPNGNHIITGSDNGEIRLWPFPHEKIFAKGEEGPRKAPFVVEASESVTKFPARASNNPAAKIDCIRFAKGNVISKTVAGRITYWHLETLETIHSFTVRNNGLNECRFDVSFDDNYICVGNAHGVVYIYDLVTGKMVRELKHRRSVRAVKCCAFTRDCRSVIYAGEAAFIWRYDYVDDETLKEWEGS